MSESLEPVVHVVDDDKAFRQTLSTLIRSVGLEVSACDSASAFLEAYDPRRPGCLLLDIRMPGISGLELLEQLAARSEDIPIIIVTGHGDVPMAVHAMKVGAVDFIEKPFSNQHLLDRIHWAIGRSIRYKAVRAAEAENTERMERLTEREHQILSLIIDGGTNKSMAYRLSISEKTVEYHRAKIMRKMNAKSLAELVKKTRARGI